MADIYALKNRYVAINGARPTSEEILSSIESKLGLNIPPEFRDIAKIFDGSGFTVMSLHSLAGNAPTMNPIHETLRLRKAIGLPLNWLVLGEPPESLLLMDCANLGKVLWIDAIDATRIASNSFSKQPDSWTSFGDFFEYLLNEEEEDRA